MSVSWLVLLVSTARGNSTGSTTESETVSSRTPACPPACSFQVAASAGPWPIRFLQHAMQNLHSDAIRMKYIVNPGQFRPKTAVCRKQGGSGGNQMAGGFRNACRDVELFARGRN